MKKVKGKLLLSHLIPSPGGKAQTPKTKSGKKFCNLFQKKATAPNFQPFATLLNALVSLENRPVTVSSKTAYPEVSATPLRKNHILECKTGEFPSGSKGKTNISIESSPSKTEKTSFHTSSHRNRKTGLVTQQPRISKLTEKVVKAGKSSEETPPALNRELHSPTPERNASNTASNSGNEQKISKISFFRENHLLSKHSVSLESSATRDELRWKQEHSSRPAIAKEHTADRSGTQEKAGKLTNAVQDETKSAFVRKTFAPVQSPRRETLRSSQKHSSTTIKHVTHGKSPVNFNPSVREARIQQRTVPTHSGKHDVRGHELFSVQGRTFGETTKKEKTVSSHSNLRTKARAQFHPDTQLASRGETSERASSPQEFLRTTESRIQQGKREFRVILLDPSTPQNTPSPYHDFSLVPLKEVPRRISLLIFRAPQGRTTAKLHLHPPKLGDLTVEFVLQGSHLVQLKISGDTFAVRKLEKEKEKLVAEIQRTGIKLVGEVKFIDSSHSLRDSRPIPSNQTSDIGNHQHGGDGGGSQSQFHEHRHKPFSDSSLTEENLPDEFLVPLEEEENTLVVTA